jgi:hypothetical protein
MILGTRKKGPYSKIPRTDASLGARGSEGERVMLEVAERRLPAREFVRACE